MLTVSKSSGAHASHYYTADLPGQSRLDSVWLGKGAEALGLSGQVEKEDFAAAMAATGPNGEALAKSQKRTRRAGLDLTFSAPKSISIEAIVQENQSVLTAHREAVKDTISAIEKEVQTRQMTDGEVAFHNTRNVVVAVFEHKINRRDQPQLHTHAIVINTTQWEGKWRSLYARRIFQKIKKWGQYYRNRLGRRLIETGHTLRRVGTEFWELASVHREIISRFSDRRKDIIDSVGANATSEQKQYACLVTRPSKSAEPLESLRKKWKHQTQSTLKHVAETGIGL